MWESFFGFKKTPFSDSPDARQLFASAAWQQVKTRLEFLTQHSGAGLLTGEVGVGKSTAARVFTTSLNPSLYKILYIHFTNGSALDLLRQIALALDLEPAHYRGDLVRQISDAIVRLNQSKKQHPILICDEAHLLPHPALEQLPLLLNFDMDSSRYLTLLLIGQPLLRRTLSLQMHEALRQRIGVHYHLEEEYASLLQSPPSRENAAALDRMSRDLYDRLWKPVDDREIDGADVCLRATGIVRAFPFESLRRRTTFVGRSFLIRHLIGSRRRSSVQELGSVLPGRDFVYAPVAKNGLDLPRLGAAIQEARFVNGIMHGHLRMGSKATRAQLDQDTSVPFSVLHFATHGTRRGNVPSLALRKPTQFEADGIELLGPADIRAMKLNGRLVVLSACESAVKPDSISGLGLGEAFVSAGAKEVIAARWTVDDAAALVFMKSLYSRLARGRDTARALRYARASMINSNYLPYNHPYF